MILNPVIQQKLAAAFGHELRYPSDFEALAMDIAERTGQGFSVNTLKRLCGLIGPEVQPRRATLDTLAQYLDAADWPMLLAGLSEAGNSAFDEGEQTLDPAALVPGERIRLRYDPDRSVELEVLEGGTLRVLCSEHSKLLPGDIVHTGALCLRYPLIADSVLRDGRDLGRFTAGQTGGLTELTRL